MLPTMRGGPALLDRFAAMLSYSLLVDVMPRISFDQGHAPDFRFNYRLHWRFRLLLVGGRIVRRFCLGHKRIDPNFLFYQKKTDENIS